MRAKATLFAHDGSHRSGTVVHADAEDTLAENTPSLKR
jgi:hypothetical protein